MTDRHGLTLEPQPIADQWMGKCSCGWRKAVSFWDIEDRDALIAVIRRLHSEHVAVAAATTNP